MTSLSWKQQQQPACGIFSFAGLFWASCPLFLESKPWTSSSQREKQQYLPSAHQNASGVGKEPAGLSWPLPKHQLGDRTPSPLASPAALIPLDRQGPSPFVMGVTPGLVPEHPACSSRLGCALPINYCCIILNRGDLLESSLNQAWNYHCGFSISPSPAEQLTQLLVEIPILKPLLWLPHESSSICSCTPWCGVARQARRGSFPLMTAICRFLSLSSVPSYDLWKVLSFTV